VISITTLLTANLFFPHKYLLYIPFLYYDMLLCRVKKARVKELREEIEDNKAQHAHMQDQMDGLEEEVRMIQGHKARLEAKRLDAMQLDKHGLANKLSIEVLFI
jgi:hypothetical protein